jgi:DNA gyrase subunit A
MISLRPTATIMTVCQNGFGKRSEVEDYRLTKRGGKGVINIRATDRNGPVIAIMDVLETDDLIMISEQGESIRFAVKDLRIISRATQGVQLKKLNEGDKLTSVARIEEDKDDNNELGEGEAENGDATTAEDTTPETE